MKTKKKQPTIPVEIVFGPKSAEENMLDCDIETHLYLIELAWKETENLIDIKTKQILSTTENETNKLNAEAL